MGTYTRTRESRINVPKERLAPVFAAVIKKYGHMMNTAANQMVEAATAQSIERVADLYGWRAYTDETGALVEIDYNGRSNLSMYEFPELIAPVVSDGSYVELEDNCGGTSSSIWRLIFYDGKVEKRNAVISF